MNKLEATGLTVGIVPGMTFQTRTCELAPEATLYLLSDGVYEMVGKDGNMMTIDDFIQLIPLFRSNGISDSEFVLRTIREHCGGTEFEDDLCLVQFTFK